MYDWKWIKSSRKIEAVLHTLNPCQSATFYGFFRGFKRLKKANGILSFLFIQKIRIAQCQQGLENCIVLKDSRTMSLGV